MVLSQKVKDASIHKVYSHPAPVPLFQNLPIGIDKVELVNSNAEAANLCLGINDACMTTKKASDENNLFIIHDFGTIPMGFAIHSFKK